jgi:hypothetical protein
MDRRDFHKLTAAALGGVLAGANLLRADDKKDDKPKPKDEKINPFLQEPHICRGLNTCKNKGGKGGKNDCAGQGACFTVEKHTCSGDNACRGIGGCGETPGENKCKGKGECAVPLSKDAWKKARKRFEEVLTKEKKKFGDAPKADKD